MLRLLACLVFVAPWGTAAAAQQAADPLLPDTVVEAPGGPRLVVLGAPVGGVAAMRLFVPFREGPVEAGVGTLLRDLALERIEALARPVGARVSATRTPWGLAYSVEGAVADFEYLAYLLREAVARPNVEGVGLTEARQRMADAVARTLETPAGRLERELRERIAPEHPLTSGTPATAPTLDAARVLGAWGRSHQAQSMTLVVSAGVVPEVILAATRGMGAPASEAGGPLEAPAPPAPTGGAGAEILRSWYGHAWSAGPPGAPEGPVAALLVSTALGRRTEGFEGGVQLWELPDRWVVAAVGASYGAGVRAMRTAVSGAVRAALDDLTEDSIRAAVASVRRDLLFRARTPDGLVALVGRAMEASGDPSAAARAAAGLDAMGAAEVRAFLERLQSSRAATAELRP